MIVPELHRLLQACKDEPDDDAPRLVLSDWLEEHGQPERAEMVRLQLRLARGEIPAGDEAVTEARIHELCRRNAEAWVGLEGDRSSRCVFRRGLIELHLQGVPLGNALCGRAVPPVEPWLETVELEQRRQQILDTFLSDNGLTLFSNLKLTEVNLPPAWLERLANSPKVAPLRVLRCGVSGSQEVAGQALARSPYLSGLRVLELSAGMGDTGLEAMVQAPLFRNLSTLRLHSVPLRKSAAALARSGPRLRRLLCSDVLPTEAGLRQLATSDTLAGLVELQMDGPGLDSRHAQALARRSEWPCLERLSLAQNRLEDEGFHALASIPELRKLRRLCLKQTRLSAQGLSRLLAAPWAAGLEWLDLSHNPTEPYLLTLASAPRLKNLRYLGLNWCGIDDDGLRALAGARHLDRLETLDLTGNRLGDAGLMALVEADNLPSLTALVLQSTGISAAGLARLARSPLAGRLRRLDLSNTHLEGDAVRALAAGPLSQLKDLRLGGNRLGEEGVRALAEGPFQDLVRLELPWCVLGDSGVRDLLRTHGFPHLTFLDLAGTHLGIGGREALAAWPRLAHLAYLGIARQSGDPPELSVRSLSFTNS
jgi:uncharacterized protein (TIGR02996 family)